jgi:hypothetical protein
VAKPPTTPSFMDYFFVVYPQFLTNDSKINVKNAVVFASLHVVVDPEL